MARSSQTGAPLSFFGAVDMSCSSSAELLVTGGKNPLDSILSHHPPSNPTISHVKSLGSAVYLHQRELLKKFGDEIRTKRTIAHTTCNIPQSIQEPSYTKTSVKKKVYKGVRQRHWGKWVAEIRLSKNRMRVWLGTYDSAEAAAFAYDCAAYKLHGEYAQLNLPYLRDEISAKLSALRSSVDAKIQAICEKARKEQASRKGVSVSRSSSNTEIEQPKGDDKSLAPVSTDGAMTADELEIEGCSLERMPSFDQDLIWEVIDT